MQRELVANNVFVFTSELYAQVTAGAIITPEGAVVIDTLPFPVETREIIKFIERRHGIPVRYVVNTHYHADHTYGTCFFEHAQVISHRLCRELLDVKGREGLDRAKRLSRELDSVSLCLPEIVFDKELMKLSIGDFTLHLWHSPGHSPDSIVVHVVEPGILFAADTMMTIPFFSDGNYDDLVNSLKALEPGKYENIVQGHGEIVLRGEIETKIREDLNYLTVLRQRVQEVVDAGSGSQALAAIDIEECGKSRIALNGVSLQLHASNRATLFDQLSPVSERS